MSGCCGRELYRIVPRSPSGVFANGGGDRAPVDLATLVEKTDRAPMWGKAVWLIGIVWQS